MFIICQPMALCRVPAFGDAIRPTMTMVRLLATCALVFSAVV